jgi:hypothetical protein
VYIRGCTVIITRLRKVGEDLGRWHLEVRGISGSWNVGHTQPFPGGRCDTYLGAHSVSPRIQMLFNCVTEFAGGEAARNLVTSAPPAALLADQIPRRIHLINSPIVSVTILHD